MSVQLKHKPVVKFVVSMPVKPEVIKRYCPCGCGPILKNEHVYIESKATEQWYGGIICLVQSEKQYMSKDMQHVKVNDDWMTIRDYREMYEVVSHG